MQVNPFFPDTSTRLQESRESTCSMSLQKLLENLKISFAYLFSFQASLKQRRVALLDICTTCVTIARSIYRIIKDRLCYSSPCKQDPSSNQNIVNDQNQVKNLAPIEGPAENKTLMLKPRKSPKPMPPPADLESELPEGKVGELIRSFWRDHIHSFTLTHGTTALYHKHFQEYGISATYPTPLHEIIGKIRGIWKNHEQEILPRTGYFVGFEDRYDQANQSEQVETSFSAQGAITHEFTTGVRKGGEWIREVRTFLRKAKQKNHVFSKKEQQTLKEIEAFIDVIDQIPSMEVKIRTTALCNHYLRRVYPLLCSSLNQFFNRIKSKFPDWNNPKKLEEYLQSTVFRGLSEEKRCIQGEYEILIKRPIPPEQLEFVFCNDVSTREPASVTTSTTLPYNEQVFLNTEQICALRIDSLGFSEIEEYENSWFSVERRDIGQWVVTRKTLDTNEALSALSEKQMRENWIRAFGYEEVASKELLDSGTAAV